MGGCWTKLKSLSTHGLSGWVSKEKAQNQLVKWTKWVGLSKSNQISINPTQDFFKILNRNIAKNELYPHKFSDFVSDFVIIHFNGSIR